MMKSAEAPLLLLPALHCAFIALELYLKSLSATEVEVADPIASDTTNIHAQVAFHSHRLERLFEQSPSDFRDAMDREVRRKPGLQRYGGTRGALLVRNEMFMASRYFFEPGRSISGIVIGELDQLLDAVESGIRSVPTGHFHGIEREA